MKWTKRTPYSIASGEWIISRATMQGQDMYTLWRGAAAVSHHDTAAKAKQAAEEKAE